MFRGILHGSVDLSQFKSTNVKKHQTGKGLSATEATQLDIKNSQRKTPFQAGIFVMCAQQPSTGQRSDIILAI